MTLSAEGIGYAYGGGTDFEVPALRDVSLALEPGTLTLVMGRTGSGKSTLLRVLAGLIGPDSGRVTADGEPPSARLVGLVFQDPETQLFAETVIDDVAFGPRNLGRGDDAAREDAAAALAAVGLDPRTYGGRSPFTLSGGEARRAAIAGVIAMRPRYLLLDEPTAGLDAAGRRAVLAAVDRASAQAGVLVVTHDPEEMLSRADRVLVLADGATVFSGSPAEALGAGGEGEAFDRAGLRAPALLDVWNAARAVGLEMAPVSPALLEPATLATALIAARGRSG